MSNNLRCNVLTVAFLRQATVHVPSCTNKNTFKGRIAIAVLYLPFFIPTSQSFTKHNKPFIPLQFKQGKEKLDMKSTLAHIQLKTQTLKNGIKPRILSLSPESITTRQCSASKIQFHESILLF